MTTRTSRFRHFALIATLAAVALLGLMATGAASAHPRGSVRIWVGAPFWWQPVPFGYYYGSPYVVERPVIVQPPVDNSVAVPAASPQAYSWYYCRDSQMYYPHVTSCASPWQEVPAVPAQESAPATATTTPAPAAAPAPRVGQPVPAAR